MSPNTDHSLSPSLLSLQAQTPSPLAGALLMVTGGLVLALITWSTVGKLDIVAVAEGKLIPASHLKIVQPAEQGIVREILVREGDTVLEGQVLMRMDTTVAKADQAAIQADFHARNIALRRIDAQLVNGLLLRQREDPPELFAQAQAQYQANRAAHENAISQERSVLDRARSELAAAEQVYAKLAAVLPHYQEQERAFKDLGDRGFAGRIMVSDKVRERVEKERDMASQTFVIRGAQASIAQSEKRIRQLAADYERQLRSERVEIVTQMERIRQDLAKIEHKNQLLELRAPQGGVVKDLATHTPGTVTAPGTILMSLVPKDEALFAEVWVKNDDIGFIRPGQTARVKLATYHFQKYGMLEGTVAAVSADAAGPNRDGGPAPSTNGENLSFKTMVKLPANHIESNGRRYALASGMQVSAEIHLGERTVLEYLLSPVSRAWHEAGRER